MGIRDLEEVLGAFRSAAAREGLGDLLTTLLTREEVSELAERLDAIRAVTGGRARVMVRGRRPAARPFTYRLPVNAVAEAVGAAILRDAGPCPAWRTDDDACRDGGENATTNALPVHAKPKRATKKSA